MIIIIEVWIFKINVAETLQKVCIWSLTPAPLWHYFPFSSDVELYLRPLNTLFLNMTFFFFSPSSNNVFNGMWSSGLDSSPSIAHKMANNDGPFYPGNMPNGSSHPSSGLGGNSSLNQAGLGNTASHNSSSDYSWELGSHDTSNNSTSGTCLNLSVLSKEGFLYCIERYPYILLFNQALQYQVVHRVISIFKNDWTGWTLHMYPLN